MLMLITSSAVSRVASAARSTAVRSGFRRRGLTLPRRPRQQDAQRPVGRPRAAVHRRRAAADLPRPAEDGTPVG